MLTWFCAFHNKWRASVCWTWPHFTVSHGPVGGIYDGSIEYRTPTSYLRTRLIPIIRTMMAVLWISQEHISPVGYTLWHRLKLYYLWYIAIFRQHLLRINSCFVTLSKYILSILKIYKLFLSFQNHIVYVMVILSNSFSGAKLFAMSVYVICEYVNRMFAILLKKNRWYECIVSCCVENVNIVVCNKSCWCIDFLVSSTLTEKTQTNSLDHFSIFWNKTNE